MNWFHKFFNPHCEHCREEYLDGRVCDSCNTLKIEINALRRHNDHLIEALLDKVKIKEETIPSQVIPQQPVNLGKSQMSWHARRQILEQEDRAVAKIKKDKQKEMEATSIEKLEDELNLTETEKELKHG